MFDAVKFNKNCEKIAVLHWIWSSVVVTYKLLYWSFFLLEGAWMRGKDLRGKRKAKLSKKLQKVKRWLADAIYINEHSDMKWIHF